MVKLPLVERDVCISTISDAIKRTQDICEPTYVNVYGLAGIGKTYLCDFYKNLPSIGGTYYAFFDFQEKC